MAACSARCTAPMRCAARWARTPSCSACWMWSGAGARAGAAGDHPGRGRDRHHRGVGCIAAGSRRHGGGDPQHRLSGGGAGQAADRAGRPGCRTLDALGRDHAGHHGHGRGAAAPRRAGADRSGPARDLQRTRAHGRHASRHGDGRAHASPARAAGHLRLQGCGLALAAAGLDRRPAPRARTRAAPVLRRCRGHAGLARCAGAGRIARTGGGTGPGRGRHPLACRARRAERGDLLARHPVRQPVQDRDRRHADVADRIWRGVRAACLRPRRVQHHAAEAQPDRLRIRAEPVARRACAGAADAGRDGAGFGARHRPLAGGTARLAAGLPAGPWRAVAGALHRRGAGGGCGADARPTSMRPAVSSSARR